MRLFTLSPTSSERPSLADLRPPDRYLGACTTCRRPVTAQDNSISVHGDVFHNECAVYRSDSGRDRERSSA